MVDVEGVGCVNDGGDEFAQADEVELELGLDACDWLVGRGRYAGGGGGARS